MKRWICGLLALIMLTVGLGAAAAGESAGEYRLEQVTVLSRHNIRSPLSEKGSMISEITPHEWFSWTSKTGELSLRGAMLETTMGQYFRLWLESEGLFPENYIPEEGAVRFYANGFQRTQATAHYFSTGLLPVAVTPVERIGELNTHNGTFLPLIRFMTPAYEADIRKEVAVLGGGVGLSGYRASLEDAWQLLKKVTDMEQTDAYKNNVYGALDTDDTKLILDPAVTEEPSMKGPIKYMCSLADALVLQYYEEPDDLKAAFGHELSEKDWKTIGSVLGTYLKILFGTPLLAPTQSHPMLEEMYHEMNTQGRKFSFLCGHDSTIMSFLTTLGVNDYELPGAIEPTTPIGVKVVFERWSDQAGKNWYQVKLVYQSVEQLRSIQPLSLDQPPMIVPLSFAGIETNADGMIAEKDLMELFRNKINRYYELEEIYGDTTEQAEEPAA